MAGDVADVVVIGAGVIGLTTALRLAEAGYRPRIMAAEPPEHTTSVAAGAFWGPYLSAHPASARWSMETLTHLRALAEIGEAGVRLVRGLEASRQAASPPEWLESFDDLRMCGDDRLPPGWATGWCYTVPVIEMSEYLAWVVRGLAARGVHIDRRRVGSLADEGLDAEVLINCSGAGARELVPDPEVTTLRGQLVVIENPGIETFFVDHDADPETMVYILPQGNRAVLGGNVDRMRTDLAPDMAVAEGIVERCAEIVPAVAHARVIEHRVGLRPGRPTIRLTADTVAGRTVIHNYGHGGGGITMAWGCAGDVCGLLTELLDTRGSVACG